MRALLFGFVLLVLSHSSASPMNDEETFDGDYQVSFVEVADDTPPADPVPGEDASVDGQNATTVNGTSSHNRTVSDHENSEEEEPWKALIPPVIHTCPMDCNFRGVCNIGYCNCTYPYMGRACEQEMCGTKQACSGKGKCVNNTVTVFPPIVCLCDDGWTGDRCDEADDECPYGCLGHGVCDNGVCVCNKGWKGDYCQDISCPNACSEHGDCLLDGDNGGRCNCTYPWHSEACDQAYCPRDCSGQGLCDIYTGRCICNETYAGIACELHLCPNNCTYPHGMCNLTTGACKCDANYLGYDCSDERCPSLCSGHGQCQSSRLCACDDRWGGVDCSQDLCWHNCSYHGFCDRAGKCFCQPNFDGDLCDVDLRCPSNCSGHGFCRNARCNCTDGWSSYDCSVSPFRCPMDYECVHGNCTLGVCECEQGWRDYDCAMEVVRMCTMDKDCYHGKCDDLGQCVCDWPWTGGFCERYMAYPLPAPDETGKYPIPDPLTLDDPQVLNQKIGNYEEKLVAARCGRFGGKRCGSPVYRRPRPLREDTRVPMGIRHSPNRAKANATHAANGTFWGDIWGNATAMWEQIREQELERAEAAGEKDIPLATAQPSPSPSPAASSERPVADANNNVQIEHAHNLKMARKHYYHARLMKRSAAFAEAEHSKHSK